MRMKILLRVHEVWNTIEPGSDDQKKNDVELRLTYLIFPLKPMTTHFVCVPLLQQIILVSILY